MTRTPGARPARSPRWRTLRRLALLGLALGAAGAAAALYFLQAEGIAPRTLAPYVARRASGHNPVITGSGKWLAATLARLDRGAAQPHSAAPLVLGAQAAPVGAGRIGTPRFAASVDEARAAMAAALPGDVITLAPGVYEVRKRGLHARPPGTADQPIVLRAEKPGTVQLHINTTEGILVSAPHWRFENLTLRGICRQHGSCEHAFHVIGEAHHFEAVNNTLLDFNAHFKINGWRGAFPDHGRIEGNTLRNESARKTDNPVTPIDLVAASDWTIRANLIADFIKLGGDRISYGAFAKGGGARTVFERNVVLCEQHLRGERGLRVGLSFGGGGSGARYCRDGRCITEQDEGVMRNNLIGSCSDVGIYLNKGARTRLVHNTLLDTAGMQVRFPESSADVEGNLVDGAIRSRNGGVLRAHDNKETSIALLYAGWHPQRRLFADAGSFDLRWDGAPPRLLLQDGAPDLCGKPRPAQAAYGAFEDYASCLAPR